jgi:Rrf2 family protein
MLNRFIFNLFFCIKGHSLKNTEGFLLKINKKVEYALIALKFMANKTTDELTSVREICDHFQTPFDTTARVMQIMNSNDILKSVKGIKGGYTISKPLNEVAFIQLAQMIESRDFGNPCITSKGSKCDLYENCNITNPIENLNKQLNRFFAQVTLDDILFDKTKIAFPSNFEDKVI